MITSLLLLSGAGVVFVLGVLFGAGLQMAIARRTANEENAAHLAELNHVLEIRDKAVRDLVEAIEVFHSDTQQTLQHNSQLIELNARLLATMETSKVAIFSVPASTKPN
jgi:hypothetical protein